MGNAPCIIQYIEMEYVIYVERETRRGHERRTNIHEIEIVCMQNGLVVRFFLLFILTPFVLLAIQEQLPSPGTLPVNQPVYPNASHTNQCRTLRFSSDSISIPFDRCCDALTAVSFTLSDRREQFSENAFLSVSTFSRPLDRLQWNMVWFGVGCAVPICYVYRWL